MGWGPKKTTAKTMGLFQFILSMGRRFLDIWATKNITFYQKLLTNRAKTHNNM
jgi:hypothetical protein